MSQYWGDVHRQKIHNHVDFDWRKFCTYFFAMVLGWCAVIGAYTIAAGIVEWVGKVMQ